jgi:hypothetical protein
MYSPVLSRVCVAAQPARPISKAAIHTRLLLPLNKFLIVDSLEHLDQGKPSVCSRAMAPRFNTVAFTSPDSFQAAESRHQSTPLGVPRLLHFNLWKTAVGAMAAVSVSALIY